jgi:hypothetical protein
MSKTVRGKKYIKFSVNDAEQYFIGYYDPPHPDNTYEEYFIGEPYNLFVQLEDTRIVEIGRATEPRLKYQYTKAHTLTVDPHDVDIPLDWVVLCEQYLIELDELEKFKGDLGMTRPRAKLIDDTLYEMMSNKHTAGLQDIDDGNYDEGIKKFQELIEAGSSVISSEYNIACCYSLKNMLDEAVEYFRRCADHGYRDWIHAITDKDLANIINDSRVVDIIKYLILNDYNPNTVIYAVQSGQITPQNIGILKTYVTTHGITNSSTSSIVYAAQSFGLANAMIEAELPAQTSDLPAETLPVNNKLSKCFEIIDEMIQNMGDPFTLETKNKLESLLKKTLDYKDADDFDDDAADDDATDNETGDDDATDNETSDDDATDNETGDDDTGDDNTANDDDEKEDTVHNNIDFSIYDVGTDLEKDFERLKTSILKSVQPKKGKSDIMPMDNDSKIYMASAALPIMISLIKILAPSAKINTSPYDPYNFVGKDGDDKDGDDKDGDDKDGDDKDGDDKDGDDKDGDENV